MEHNPLYGKHKTREPKKPKQPATILEAFRRGVEPLYSDTEFASFKESVLSKVIPKEQLIAPSKEITEEDRVIGSLLGLTWGDVLGCPIEGWR